MTENSLFISSCSRRQLARRRPARGAWATWLWLGLLIAAIGFAVFVVGYGGF